MRYDLLVAIRSLIKRPGYTVSVVLILALGIGASTMMFSVLDAALLRPPAFRDPDRLLMLWGVAGPERAVRGASFPEAADWRARNQTLGGAAIYDETSVNLQTGTEAIRVEAEMVSGTFFDLLGVTAAVGRTLTADDDSAPDASPVAVISNALWRERFGGSPDVLTRSVLLNDRSFTIVGVMPEGFAGLSADTDLWFPAMMVSITSAPAVLQDRGTRWLGVLARLRDGVTREQAQGDLDRVAASLERDYPASNRERGVRLLTLREAQLGSTEPLVKALFAAVLLFLLVACANVSSLALARATARRQDQALRVALGAGRWHLLRQVLVECLVLAAAAGVAGAILAAWGTSAAAALMPEGALPRYVQPAVDPRVLLFVICASAGCGLLVALLPGLSGSGRQVIDILKTGARSASGGLGALRRPSAQQVLVVAEIGLAMTLLVAAGLMAQSLARRLDVRLGFNPQGVTVARITLPASRYTPPQRVAFVERLTEALAREPGVRDVAVGSDLPLTGSWSASLLLMPEASSRDTIRYYRHFVTPDFFRTLGLTVLRGRAFTAQDRLDTQAVAIISDSGARRLWPGRDAVGSRFRISPTAPEVTIVGVTADARFRDLTTDLSGARTEPDIYFPYAQRTDRDLEIAARSVDGQAVPLQVLTRALASVDPALPVYRVRPLTDVVAAQTATPKLGAALLALFSIGAVALTAIGLYGVVSYVVGLSRREIAIRLALGASRHSVVAIVLRNVMLLAGAGLALGIVGALAAGRAIAAQLFLTPATDARTFVLVALTITAVAAFATWLPARRASRLDPHAALRAE